jgi:MYXO-CTERM domain-containing protein
LGGVADEVRRSTRVIPAEIARTSVSRGMTAAPPALRHLSWTLAPALLAGGLLAAPPRAAHACGGFFCGNVPVVQTGEQIVFAVDEARGEVDVTIRIAYAGPPTEFAWLLPLRANPTRIGLGTDRAFQAIDRVTAARFVPNLRDNQCFAVDAAVNFGDAGARDLDGGPTPPPVTVLQQSDVGAFSSVVLAGTDTQAVRAWLVENGYRVTDTMMEAVVPYLSNGDVLLALRLQSGRMTGELQPIGLTIPMPEPCIPLRLTAIAAQDDMPVTAVVFSKTGRAVPQNYLHVELNPRRIAWLNRGSNWPSLVAAAVDQAGGNAFATEWAGPASQLAAAIARPGEYDLSALRTATVASTVLAAVGEQGLNARREVQGILQGLLTTEQLTAVGIDATSFWGCPQCDPRAASLPLSGAEVARLVEERIITPDTHLQTQIDAMRYGTRLYTVISPEEMNVDPIFAFRTDLPDVPALRQADVFVRCDASGLRVEVEIDGRRLPADFSGVVDGAAPAAIQIANLFTREIIDEPMPSPTPSPSPSTPGGSNTRPSDDCTCTSAGSGAPAALGWLAVGALLAARRRRR